jgi:multidrug efflux pump subunit AcrA (membrane-fusion protein)
MRQFPFKSILAGLAIFSVGVGGFIQLTQSKPKAEVRETSPSAWRVSTQYVRLQTVSPVFNGFGSVQNPDTQTLKARVLTDVIGLYAREGTRVDAGQLLMELDPTDAEIKLSQAKANLADAKSGLITLNATEVKDKEALNLDLETLNILTQKLTRILDLKKRNLTSEQDLDTARQAVVVQKLQINRRELALATVESKRTQVATKIQRFETEVRAATRDLKSTQVKAPANGQVIGVNVVSGDRVQANQNLLTFAPDSGREIRVQVPASIGLILSNALSTKTPVIASTDRGGSLQLNRVSGAVRDNTGSIDAFFVSNAQLPPTGSVLSISIRLVAEPSVVVLPTDAIYGGNLIYRITSDDTLEAVTVEHLGQRPGITNTEVLVRSPNIQDGDQILVSRLPAAVTGLKVEIIR